MNIKKSIEYLKFQQQSFAGTMHPNMKLAMHEAIKALEKQIPQSPDYEADGYDENGALIYDTAFCPVCNYEFEYNINDWGCKFCCNCGQALKWED